MNIYIYIYVYVNMITVMTQLANTNMLIFQLAKFHGISPKTCICL